MEESINKKTLSNFSAQACVAELIETGKDHYKVNYSTIPAPMPGKVTREFLSFFGVCCATM